MATQNEGSWNRKFHTYSGSDIVVTATHPAGNIIFGELMAISYSVNREKYPVRVLGSAPVLAFTKGPRTVAGTLVFSVFDEHALAEMMTIESGLDMSGHEIVARVGQGREISADQIDLFGDDSRAGISPAQFNHYRIHTVDDIPPFDVTITFANEYGSTSAIRILGVELVDDGAVMSIQDLVTQNTISYVARDIILLTATDSSFKIAQRGAFRR